MKVVCIDNKDNYFNLTIGKTYEVIHENTDGIYVTIADDNGDKRSCFKFLFKTISEIRNDKIDKLLGL